MAERPLTCCFLGLLAATTGRANTATDLERARNAYQYGNYLLVMETLQPLLYPNPVLASTDQVVEARRLLGLAYLWLKDDGSAEREFVALLTLRPDAALDPLVDPPPFVEVFERIKTRMREQLAEIRRKQEEEAHARENELSDMQKKVTDLRERLARSESTAYLVETSEKSRLFASLPFGLGQFQNKHTRKGVAFLASELALGAASVTLATMVRIRWPDGTFPAEERDDADALVSAQVLTGVAFLAVALWGIVDAHAYFVPKEQSVPRRVPKDSLRVHASGSGLVFLWGP